ncbi:MAG: helix-turn-helix transcriptional regulator [Candidatus Lokiarchaeota archaeon]|nr:helix-turn-helix transcriptional regulator [Candidatus Lokiarchaeota archaeon]
MGKKLIVKGKNVKLSPLEFMILLKVYQADPVGISGYDLINDLNRTFAGLWVPQSGTIYPLLSRMQSDKYIVGEEQKSELGPAKKVFRLTDFSRSFIEVMLLDNFEPELTFFSNYLDFIVEMMIKVRKKDPASGINFPQVKLAIEHFATHVQDTLKKVEGFAAELEGGGYPPCRKCGAVVDRSARFCPACGNPVAAE